MNIREAVIEEVNLLAQPSKQLEYERSLTIAGHAPSELICGFCDDLYHPKDAAFLAAFNSDELKDLAHLYGVIREAASTSFATVGEMLKDPKWRRVVAVAQGIASRLEAVE